MPSTATIKQGPALAQYGVEDPDAQWGTYPECDEADLRATLTAIADLDPITLFHEPINIRAENVERIRSHAQSLGVELNTEVFASPQAWQDYALAALQMTERLASSLNLKGILHLWPDKSLGTRAVLIRVKDQGKHFSWLQNWWTRISEWPR